MPELCRARIYPRRAVCIMSVWFLRSETVNARRGYIPALQEYYFLIFLQIRTATWFASSSFTPSGISQGRTETAMAERMSVPV